MNLIGQKRHFIILTLIGLIVVVYQGCSPAVHTIPTGDDASAASFESPLTVSAMKVIDKHCISCHGQGASQGGFSGIDNLDNLISIGVILPGDPDNSQLIRLIESNSMPTTYSLSAVDKLLLRDWVTSLESDIALDTPSCLITTDKLLIDAGETVALTLTVIGAADSAILAGQEILVSGETIFVTPTQDTVFSGSVSWDEGTSDCSSPMIMVN